MKHLSRVLTALLLALASAASAQVSINAPAPPRPVLSTDSVLVKLVGDPRGYLLPIASMPGITLADGSVTTAKLGGDIVTFGKTFLQSVDAAAARTALGLVIGTNVQAYDVELAALAGLTSAADRLPYYTGSGTAALATFTAAGRALVGDADNVAQRARLGLGGAAVLNVGTASGTVAAGDDSRLTDDRTASGLRTASGIVSVSAATAPTAGQVLMATSGTAAAWATPATGGVSPGRTISTTAPLTGGGDLSADRTLSINAATTSTPGSMSAADKTKLDSIAAGATANATDAALRDRSTHTGSQAAGTISDFASASRTQAEAALIAGDNISITPAGTGATRTLTIASTAAGVTDGSVTDAKVAAGAAIAESKLSLASDAAAGTASRRTLGTGALQAAAGNDARLSDARVPTDGSVTDAKVAAGAAIAESKLSLASDAAAGVPSRRTLGTGALQAAAGNDVRLSDQRVPTDGSVTTTKLNSSLLTAFNGKLGAAETGGATLAFGAVPDGAYLRRSGTSLVGDSAAAVTSVTLSELAGIAASSNTGRVVRITDLGNVGSVFVVSNGSNWVPWGGQQMIWIAAPNSTLSGTTTEDEHTSVAPTMPAGLLTSRGAIDVRAWVDFSANVSGNTVRIKANGTNVYSVNTTQQFNSAAILIANDNSTTAQFAPAIPTLTSGGSSGAETALSINTGTTAIAITVHTQVADGGTSRTVKRVEAWWRDR